MLMASDATSRLVLADLNKGLPAITAEFGASLAQAGAVCLADHGHPQGVELTVSGSVSATFNVYWPEVTDQMRRCWNDDEMRTEYGAYGIAVFLVEALARLAVMERAKRGTGFDYWLGETDRWPFQRKAHLEVTGIRRGDE